jgi:hypothetical protein
MIGLGDSIKLGAGGIAGGAVVGGLVWLWFTVFVIPGVEDEFFKAGEDHCRAEVDEEHNAELARQRDANEEALAAARERERALAEQNDTLNERFLDLANAITSDDSSARLCLGAERVRDLNAIR